MFSLLVVVCMDLQTCYSWSPPSLFPSLAACDQAAYALHMSAEENESVRLVTVYCHQWSADV